MDLKECFDRYAQRVPEKHTAVQNTSLSLRRGGVTALEQLRHFYREQPSFLEGLRGIGPQRMALIGEILAAYPAPEESKNPEQH